MGGYSDSDLPVFHLSLDIAVAVEFDDARVIWFETHSILAGVSDYAHCRTFVRVRQLGQISLMITMWPNQTPEPTADKASGFPRSVWFARVIVRRRLSFIR